MGHLSDGNVLTELSEFYKSFDGVKGYIGYSELGKPVFFFAVEKTLYPVIIAQYAIHAREYVTSYLAMRQIELFKKNGRRGTVYFIPAANPDGIEVALIENPLYKANARGVDLNVNFDARWGTGRFNKFRPGDSDYVGESAFSESETRALRDFTLFIRPDSTISYHAKGEEIYWEFYQDEQRRKRDYVLAKKLSDVTGYPLKGAANSAGGYKDWCIEKLKIPAFTFEVGRDELSHPLGKEHAAEITEKNKGVLNAITEAFGKI